MFNTYGLCQEHTLLSPGQQPFCHTSAAIIGQSPHIAASYSGGGYMVAWGSGTKTEWSSRIFPPATEGDGEVSGAGMREDLVMMEGRGREVGGRGSGQLSSIHPFLSLQPYMPGIRSNKSLWLTPNERVTLVDSLSATPTASDCGQLAAIL